MNRRFFRLAILMAGLFFTALATERQDLAHPGLEIRHPPAPHLLPASHAQGLACREVDAEVLRGVVGRLASQVSGS